MMSLETCFFCCENISKINQTADSNEELEGSLNAVDYDSFGSTVTDCKKTKENLLRISSYLNISRTIIDKDEEDTCVIKTCQDCSKISENLSDFCSQLEIVQMNIKYYLNQLTDKINRIPEENYGKWEQQLGLQNFQKVFHQKCLLRRTAENVGPDPHIRLGRCPNAQPPPVPVQDFKLEDFMDSSSEIANELDIEHQVLKIKEEPTTSALPTNEELHSCPFCTFVVQGNYEELHSHISNEHPEQFENDQVETSSIPTIISTDQQKKVIKKLNKQHDKKELKCNQCGKNFTLMGNLRRHLRTSLICAQDVDADTALWGNFECSSCKRRYTRRDYLKYHLKNVCKTGLLVDLEIGKKAISLSTSDKKIKTTKFSNCEHCGMLVHSKNLSRHVNLKHANGNVGNTQRKEKTCEICNVPFGSSGNFRNHMLLAHGVQMPVPEKMYGCKVCHKSYERKRSLRRHLEISEKCRKGGKQDYIIVGNAVKIQNRQEEEPVLFLSIPETNYTENGSMVGVEINIEDDPLQM